VIARGPIGGRGLRTARRGRSAWCARPWRSSSCTPATLVHDDLIDGAQLAARTPTVARRRRTRGLAIATGDLLFSRGVLPSSPRNDDRRAAASAFAGQLGARGRELLQREDAYAPHVAVERYLRRCELKDGGAVRGRLPAGALTAAGGSWSARRTRSGAFAPGASVLAFQMLDDVRRRVRPRVEAHRQSRGQGPARRHGHAATDTPRREREQELAAFDLARWSAPIRRRRCVRRIAATGALGRGSRAGSGGRRGREGGPSRRSSRAGRFGAA